MKSKRFSEEEIIGISRDDEAGPRAKLGDLTKRLTAHAGSLFTLRGQLE